ncbi:MAG: hypothetical protein KatS3mg097_502 [Candidatus Parcubacteria bacterium]|nr:MAG: hypothetical protein KatS3mg097_502 [Candidatus Parcubacteria bacterium]
MNKQQLIEKLDYSARKYLFPLKTRFLKFPFITLRDAFITILFNKVLRQKIYFLVKAKTFFEEDFYCIFPESTDVYFYGAYVYCNPEYRLTRFIIKHNFKDNLIFFDLGAHYGYYSVLMSKLYPQSKVFAFEPDRGVLEILKKNKRENIEIIPKAVGSFNGKTKFYSFDLLSSGVSTLNIENLKKIPLTQQKPNEYEVEVITLDSFCEENKIIPDFIKIDVEGAEEDVLRGSTKLLKNKSPIIALEIWFRPTPPENYLNAVNILKNNEFKMFAITENGDLEEVNYDNIFEYFKKLEERYKKINQGIVFDNLIFLK